MKSMSGTVGYGILTVHASMIFLFRSGSYVSLLASPQRHTIDQILILTPTLSRFRQKCRLVLNATRQHARNLGFFALVYKATMLFLRHSSPTHKERHYDSFLAGLIGGYVVFSRDIQNPVSQQIVIYVFARVCLAVAKLSVQTSRRGQHGVLSGGGGGGGGAGGRGGILSEKMKRELARNGWPAFAALSWASVMYVFRWHPETVQSSLRSSMSYMWVSLLLLLLLLLLLFLVGCFGVLLTGNCSYVQSDHWDSLRTLIWHNK
jgi:hypothetical protein